MIPLYFMDSRKMVFTKEDEELFNTVFVPFGINTEQFCNIKDSATQGTFAPGDTIVVGGELNNTVVFLLSGEALGYRWDPETGTVGSRPSFRFFGRLSEGNPECVVEEKPSPMTRRKSVDAIIPYGSLIGGAGVKDRSEFERPREKEVRAETEVKYWAWNISDLEAIMEQEKAWQSAVYSMLYSELLSFQDDMVMNIAAYQSVLAAVVADGRVDPTERAFIKDYQVKHNITQQEHLKILEDMGWTREEWEAGSKLSLAWPGSQTDTTYAEVFNAVANLELMSKLVEESVARLRPVCQELSMEARTRE